jgi:hypothetical protein
MEMEEWSGQEKVMKQKGKLRERKEPEKIFIDNDLTKQERKIQKKLKTIAKEEKGKRKRKVGYKKIRMGKGRGGTVETECGMKKGGILRFFSRERKMEWRKRRQRK